MAKPRNIGLKERMRHWPSPMALLRALLSTLHTRRGRESPYLGDEHIIISYSENNRNQTAGEATTTILD